MSSWGLKDNAALAGTVTTNDATTAIAGSSTTFLGNVNAGDYLFIDGVKYQVATVTSDTALTITNFGSANASGKTAYVQTGPKYVQNVVSTGNTYSAATIYGVDAEEAGVPENRARNLKTPGWVNYTTYTDALSSVRHKGEVLVALSKNFNAASISDAADDAVAADYLLYFTTQPASASADTGNGITFVSVAVSNPTGATLAYQWQENNTTHTYNLSDAGVYSGTGSNTLVISDVTGLDGYAYSVVISAAGTGADNNTSSEATLTETTP